jgi:hypothetical protein
MNRTKNKVPKKSPHRNSSRLADGRFQTELMHVLGLILALLMAAAGVGTQTLGAHPPGGTAQQ